MAKGWSIQLAVWPFLVGSIPIPLCSRDVIISLQYYYRLVVGTWSRHEIGRNLEARLLKGLNLEEDTGDLRTCASEKVAVQSFGGA